MRIITNLNVCLSLVLLCMLPVSAQAIPAITCHCFTDRSFDPAHPTLADPYFLATTQNSFFATVFAVDKKTIVMKKQKGALTADLWIAYSLSSRSDTDPETLLQARKTKGSWKQVADSLRIPAKAMGQRFAAELKANASDERLSDAVVDELLLRFRFYDAAELAALRTANASNQELIFAAMIAFKTQQPASRLYLEVKDGGKSWGTLLDRADIQPAEIQKEIDALIRRT